MFKTVCYQLTTLNMHYLRRGMQACMLQYDSKRLSLECCRCQLSRDHANKQNIIHTIASTDASGLRIHYQECSTAGVRIYSRPERDTHIIHHMVHWKSVEWCVVRDNLLCHIKNLRSHWLFLYNSTCLVQIESFFFNTGRIREPNCPLRCIVVDIVPMLAKPYDRTPLIRSVLAYVNLAYNQSSWPRQHRGRRRHLRSNDVPKRRSGRSCIHMIIAAGGTHDGGYNVLRHLLELFRMNKLSWI